MSRNESEETATSRGVTEADREKSSEKRKIGGTDWEKMKWKNPGKREEEEGVAPPRIRTCHP